MARPQKHPKTGVYWFRKAVPSDLRPILGKTEVVKSLRTKDVAAAREAHAKMASEVEAYWKALRESGGAPIRLLQEQVAALAGEYHATFLRAFGREPGPVTRWRQVAAEIEDAVRPRVEPDEDDPYGEVIDEERSLAMEAVFGRAVDELLASKVLRVDAETRSRLLEAIGRAKRDAAIELERRAGGDYSAPALPSRYPQWLPPAAPDEASGPAPSPVGETSITSLVEGWWKEAQLTGAAKLSTYEGYRSAVRMFVAYLKHDDARRVTPEGVVGFKDHRLASTHPRTGKPISAKTVKTADLVALKSVFGWAVNNRLTASNPVVGVTLKLKKRVVTRSKGFTDEEAMALLQAADARTQGGDQAKTFAAKQWAPWLCAYTGARVGELAQLRRQDVRQEGDHWVIRITPEAGTVKTNEARDVVLHPHLVEKGFPAFVQGSASGHLFLTIGKAGDVRGPLRGLKNRLAETARETVTDERVQPNHGWRHRFKAVALSVGMDSRLADAIQGHAPSTEGARYGDNTVAAMALAIAKFPRQG